MKQFIPVIAHTFAPLTRREMDIVYSVNHNEPTQAIAKRLDVSVHDVAVTYYSGRLKMAITARELSDWSRP